MTSKMVSTSSMKQENTKEIYEIFEHGEPAVVNETQILHGFNSSNAPQVHDTSPFTQNAIPAEMHSDGIIMQAFSENPIDNDMIKLLSKRANAYVIEQSFNEAAENLEGSHIYMNNLREVMERGNFINKSPLESLQIPPQQQQQQEAPETRMNRALFNVWKAEVVCFASKCKEFIRPTVICIKAKSEQMILKLKDTIEEVGASLHNLSLLFFAAVLQNVIQLLSSGYSDKPMGKATLLANGAAFVSLLIGHMTRDKKRTLSALLLVIGTAITAASYLCIIYSVI